MMPKGHVSAATARKRSKPDMSGNSASRSTISGLSVPAASIAALPQAASPTTCISPLHAHSPTRLSRARAWSSTINTFTTRWATTVLRLPGAHCRWKAGLRTEVALDGLHLVIFKPQILHVAEMFAVLGPTNVHHKRLVATSKHPLQVKPLDEINL